MDKWMEILSNRSMQRDKMDGWRMIGGYKPGGAADSDPAGHPNHHACACARLVRTRDRIERAPVFVRALLPMNARAHVAAAVSHAGVHFLVGRGGVRCGAGQGMGKGRVVLEKGEMKLQLNALIPIPLR